MLVLGAILLALGFGAPHATSVPDGAAATTNAAIALASPFTHGVAAGDMTSNSVILWTRTGGPATVIPELSRSPSFDNPVALTSVQATEAADYTVKLKAGDLAPGTRYYYRFRADGQVSPPGTFKTAYAPEQDVPVTMAFSGDADALWRPFPLLTSLVKEHLDYFVFLGDLIYEWEEGPDTASAEDLAGYRFKYRENREPRPDSPSQMVPMIDLYRSFGQYSIFDNHELAYSQADRSAPPYVSGGARRNGQFVNQTPGFTDRIQAYTEYQPVRMEEIAGTGDPRMDGTRKFYQALSWGANVEMIILDDRSYRDEQLATTEHPQAASCSRTILGTPQLRWFENVLLSAQARNVVWKVVIVSSPIPQLGPLDAPKSWAGGYACERNRVLKFIDDHAIDNVVFLTTDYHYTAINTLKYNTDPGDQTSPLKSARNSFEVMTGPLGAFSDPSFQAEMLGVDVTGLPGRDADRAILNVWNAMLEASGLDPIGLPANFPGLVASSVRAQSVSPGVVEPLAFASLGTLTYAVLALDRSTLAVEVKGMEAVFDWPLLLNPQIEQEYENRQAEQILRFEIMAQ